MKNYVFAVEVVRTDENKPVTTLLRGTNGQVIDVCEDINTSVNTFISSLYEKAK